VRGCRRSGGRTFGREASNENGDIDQKDTRDIEEKGSFIATSEEQREMNKLYFDL